MGHVLLIGFMGAGKSTVGRLLAGSLGWPFVDLDHEVERRRGRSVADIFAQEGESGFRAAETEALRSLAQREPSVVACGGGIVLDPDNRVRLRSLGTVVHLSVTADEVVARCGGRPGRPLLAGLDPEGVRDLLDSRRPLYEESADITVPTSSRTPALVAREVELALEGRAA